MELTRWDHFPRTPGTTLAPDPTIPAKLYGDQLVILLQNTIKSVEPAKAVTALQVFRDVSCRVTQRETLNREVMNSVVLLIQEDQRPNKRTPSRCAPRSYKWAWGSSERWLSRAKDKHWMVSLPELINLLCQPYHILVFMVFSQHAKYDENLQLPPRPSKHSLNPTQADKGVYVVAPNTERSWPWPGVKCLKPSYRLHSLSP
ncbi:uncharacterized protein LOC129009892 isoform X2 [Pongo pygmaeus]|uniref:uncharacterized protein LOC129009892 isoform X2 n=1 Tax=Pongo pygmaeus TaxID=9600 RepID=UPI0023E2AA1E|nr:uncharacterized protein LOC129009892 isoform X2 [Pongo pygmaeus]